MARTKTPAAALRVKQNLAERLAALRTEFLGNRGGPELARRLGLPIRTWYNYEAGLTVPAEVILKLIELTSVEPMWLLHGTGPMYRHHVGTAGPESAFVSAPSVVQLIRAALDSLECGDETASTDADWMEPSWERRWIRVIGNAMAPIVADGAYVRFASDEESAESLQGQLVVALVEGETVFRWFYHHCRFAVLRAEKSTEGAAEVVIDLAEKSKERWFRRVVRVNTPH